MVRIAFEKKTIRKLESIRVHFKMKAESVSELVDELCETIYELNSIIADLVKISKKNTLLDLLKQLLILEKNSTKKERLLFFILKELSNSRTVFLKSIINRLSWMKPCTTQEAQNIIKTLEKQELVIIIKECPNCTASFHLLFDRCENCGNKLILQNVYFKDKRLRPRYAIEITDKGKLFVREWIQSYLSIHSFFNIWNKIKLKLS